MQFSTKTTIATFLGKLSQKLIRTLRLGGGKAAPGLVALKIDQDFVKNRVSNIDTKILIMGTNGKTTTTNIIANILQNSKINFLTNPTGSNLLRGVAATALNIKKDTSHLLLEVDEAAVMQVAPQVNPTHILITNLFRDQLDRYGELNSLINKWLKLFKILPKLTLIVNADDANLVFLAKKLEKYHSIIYFGIDGKGESKKLDDSADAIFCPQCQQPLKYSQLSFSHLGHFSCQCGFERPKCDCYLNNIEYKCKNTLAKYTDKQGSFGFTTSLLGSYNLYNCLAAISLTREIGIKSQNIKNSLENFVPTFGRQEIISVNNLNVHFYLVKNPTGFNQVIQTLSKLNKPFILAIMLNDNLADGTDVSWIWDVDFEKINNKVKKVMIGGSRAFDMAIRLKYAGFNLNNMEINQNFNNFYQNLINQSTKNVYLLPTYTAMLTMRKKLLKK